MLLSFVVQNGAQFRIIGLLNTVNETKKITEPHPEHHSNAQGRGFSVLEKIKNSAARSRNVIRVRLIEGLVNDENMPDVDEFYMFRTEVSTKKFQHKNNMLKFGM